MTDRLVLSDRELTGGNFRKFAVSLLQFMAYMANLTREDVLKLAKLARLSLSDDELDAFTSEFEEILGYVEQLQSVDTDGLAPTNQVSGNINVMREDEIVDYGYESHELLKNLPAVEDDQIKVRRMVG